MGARVSFASRAHRFLSMAPKITMAPRIAWGAKAVAGRILIGTASWTDKTLVSCKRFYLRGCSSAEDRLRYYASRFPLVEVDSSYYAMPSQRNSELWAERTPEHFTFNMKAFRLFTGHQKPLKIRVSEMLRR
jgi:uncharacterized protein YecE (DUF72 family)